MSEQTQAAQEGAAFGIRAAGSLFGAMFRAAGVLRGGKPIHPKGVIFNAAIRRTGSQVAWGCPWLDEPGEHIGTARLSRSVGLPAPVPDIHGLAVTFIGDDGERHDALLATTGASRWGRFVLVPRSEPYGCTYGSLFPYRSPRGLVLVAASPFSAVSAPDALVAVSFRLQVAAVAGPWHTFGTLRLTSPEDGLADEPLRFDPVLYPLPGLQWPIALQGLREPAYAAARCTPAQVG